MVGNNQTETSIIPIGIGIERLNAPAGTVTIGIERLNAPAGTVNYVDSSKRKISRPIHLGTKLVGDTSATASGAARCDLRMKQNYSPAALSCTCTAHRSTEQYRTRDNLRPARAAKHTPTGNEQEETDSDPRLPWCQTKKASWCPGVLEETDSWLPWCHTKWRRGRGNLLCAWAHAARRRRGSTCPSPSPSARGEMASPPARTEKDVQKMGVVFSKPVREVEVSVQADRPPQLRYKHADLSGTAKSAISVIWKYSHVS